MTAYRYNENGKFIGEFEPEMCPITSEPILPFNSTTIAPPTPNLNCYVAFVDDSWHQIEIPQPTPEDIQNTIIKNLTRSLEAHYDSVAHRKQYDNRYTCAIRASGGDFQSEGLTFITWMDSCNTYAYQVMADCLLGNRSIPSETELIAELPSAPW